MIIKKILSMSMIFFILSTMIIPYIAMADVRPESIRVITDEAEKEALLGTTSEKARRENILGLSSYFSLFTKEDITVTKADAEGRIASGGTITSTAGHPYHAGTEVENDNLAKIIAQDGISSNLELNFTTHSYNNSSNVTYDYNKKKIAAVGTNASRIDWSSMTTEQLNNIVAADLIDFDKEFAFLQQQSNYFAGLEPNGTVSYDNALLVKGYGSGDATYAQAATYNTSIGETSPSLKEGPVYKKAAIFTGYNKVNVFEMNVDEFNRLTNYDEYKDPGHGSVKYLQNNIVFNVPKDSYIIINIQGQGTVDFSSTVNYSYVPYGQTYSVSDTIKIAKCNVYFAITDEEIAEMEFSHYRSYNSRYDTYSDNYYDSTSSGAIVYAYDNREWVRNEKEEIQAFKLVSGYREANEKIESSAEDSEYASRLLYNIPQATKFTITNSVFGNILAPNADGSDNAYGYINGNIICKSYTGGIQFGYAPYKGIIDQEYDVKISKIDSRTNENIKETTFVIKDIDGNIVTKWTTDDNISTVRLRNGKYILEEISSAENYEKPVVYQNGFEVVGYSDHYTIKLGTEETTKSLIRKTYSMADHGIYGSQLTRMKYAYELYNIKTPGLIEAIGNHRITEYEYTIQTDITEELYYIVATNGIGLYYDANTKIEGTDWVEHKKWTNVKEGIKARVPLSTAMMSQTNSYYSGDTTYSKSLVWGYAPHFYTADGVDVTEQVTVTNITAVWYEPGETTTTTYTAASNVTLNEAEDTLIVTNDHIKTTIELSKVDKDEPATLLSGAVYELQDAEGTVLNTFAATGTDGKSTLEDLMLDAGTYYLVERTAPAGYKVSEEKIEVTVKPHTSETITKTVEDEIITVDIQKQDEYGNSLAGAKLQVLDKNKTVVATFESTEEIKEIKKLATGTYTLHEEYAPKGFEKAEDIEFTITTEGKVQVNGEDTDVLTMVDKTLKGQIQITKYGEKIKEVTQAKKLDKYDVYKFMWQNSVLENVMYELYAKDDILVNGTKIYSKDEKIAINTTGLTGVATFEGLPEGDYYVLEVSAPDQYEVDTEKHYISLIATYDSTTNEQELVAVTDLTNERKKETIELNKTEKGSDVAVEGAVYGLYNQEEIVSIEKDTLLDVVMTDEEGKGKFDVDLPVGNYYVKEIEAPEGYILSEEVEMINFNETTDFVLNVEDDYIKINISKVNKDGEMLEGAKLQVVDKEGNVVVEEWETTKESKEIAKILKVGETYTLQETVPPTGYATAVDKDFVVLNTGDVQTVEMVDYDTKVEIAKKNEQGKILEGAELKLVKVVTENGTQTEKEIETWTSGITAHKLTRQLVVGSTYRIIEIAPPAGYITAKPVDFTVEDTDQIQEFAIEDKETKISIYKQDENENNIAGARLQILDKDNNVIDEWVSTTEAHEINGVLAVGETYTLKEIDPPPGFVLGENEVFTVEDKEDVQVVLMNNKATKVLVEKVDEEGKALAGAKLQVTTLEKEFIDSWVSTEEPYNINDKLVYGEVYVLKELEAPAGYTIAEDVVFTVNKEQEVQVVTMRDERLNIQIQKVDDEDNLIEGASLQITDETGNEIESWTSSSTENYIVKEKLKVGETYILKETRPADGYLTAKAIEFTISNTKDPQVIKMIDEQTKITLAKYDEDGNLVPGATMQVVDEEGNEIETWVTGNTAHDIVGKLIVGKKYILKELQAPDGYAVAEDIEFTIEDTNENQDVNMTEQGITIEISKLGEAGEFVVGAELELLDRDGNVVDAWTTTNNVHTISNKLVSGETYTLTEKVPGPGYILAEDIEIKVENTGKVQEYTMIDYKTQVSILKVNEEGEAIEGATLQLWDEDGNIVDEWITDGTAKEYIGKLVMGKTYRIKETNVPDGYVTSAEKTFTVKNEKEMQEIVMTDNRTKVTISKQDITTSEELPGAKLRIEKIDETVVEEWISTDKPHEINGTLVVGETYKLVEETAPDGYIRAEEILFKVEDTEEIQTVVMKDDYTKVLIEKVDEKGNYLAGAELQIVDKNGNVVEKWTTDGKAYEITRKLKAGEKYTLEEVAAPKGYKKAANIEFTVSEDGKQVVVKMVDKKISILSTSPKAGESMMIYAMVGLLAVASIVLIVTVCLNKRKNKKEDIK